MITGLHKDTFSEIFFSVAMAAGQYQEVAHLRQSVHPAHKVGKRRLTGVCASGGAWGLYLHQFHLV